MRGTSIAGSRLVVSEWEGDAAVWPQAPLHLHREDDEAWYVLQGVLRFQVGDEVIRLGPGGSLVVPADTPHTFWIDEGAPARYVIVMTRQIAALIDAIHSAPDRSSVAMAALFERFGSQILEG